MNISRSTNSHLRNGASAASNHSNRQYSNLYRTDATLDSNWQQSIQTDAADALALSFQLKYRIWLLKYDAASRW